MSEPNPEIGRELMASEIKVGMVVVIAPPAADVSITMNVVDVDDNIVVFGSPMISMLVINVKSDDDTLKDDLGRIVRVYEYLGT